LRQLLREAQSMREIPSIVLPRGGASLARWVAMKPTVRVYDYVNRPFARVATALADDAEAIIQRATHAASERAMKVGAKLHAHLGPIDVTTHVAIELGPQDETPLATGHSALRIPITWRAIKARRAFPVMEAELLVYALTPTETQIELAGSYDPPLGLLGRAIDKVLLHQIAEASVLQFVQDIARYLREDRASLDVVR
jgi:hypothetical protein